MAIEPQIQQQAEPRAASLAILAGLYEDDAQSDRGAPRAYQLSFHP